MKKLAILLLSVIIPFAMIACGGTDENADTANEGEVQIEEGSLEGTTQSAPDFIAPGYGTEDTISVETLKKPSAWYGTITVSDYDGPYPETEGEFEAWAYLETDASGIDYFETYVLAPYGEENSVVFSSWSIELHDYTFFPIVDDYAWILDAPLKEEDNTWYTPTLTNGVLSASYDYDYNGETFTYVYEFAQIDDGTTFKNVEEETAPDENTSQEESPVESTEVVDIAPSFTDEELQAIADAMRADAPQDTTYGDWSAGMNYATVLEKYTGGVEGVPSIDETWGTIKYHWFATDNETSNFYVEFGSAEESSNLRSYGYSAFILN